MLFTGIVAAFLLLISVWYLFTKQSDKANQGKRLPDIPSGNLPLIGHLYMFKSDPIDTLMSLGQKYKGIFRFGFGPTTAVMITDAKLIEQAMKDDSLPSRPLKEMESQVLVRGARTPDGSLPGIAFSDGSVWREQRKFAFSQLINMGFGKTDTIEEIIRVECDKICQRLDIEANKKWPEPILFDCNSFISNALNVVWHFISGGSTQHSDKLLISAQDFMRSQAPGFVSTLQLYSPSLMMLTTMMGFKNMLTARRDVDVLINREVKRHEQTLNQDNIRDFMDAYLLKIQETKDEKSSFFGPLGKLNMRNSIFDLFIAGMDTTATTLSWCILFMIKWPEIQTKVQEEYDRVFGSNTPSLKHRSQTPYCEATLLEVQRLATVVPWAPRATLKDVKVGEYDIPKDTHVLCIIKSLTHNPEFFPNPEEFKPERFLNEDGTKFIKDDRVATFGFGKRKCPGEAMARLELYLFFVTMFGKYRFEAYGDKLSLSIKGQMSLTHEPNPVLAVVSKRKNV